MRLTVLGAGLASVLLMAACTGDPRLNVFVITLDTTRADHLGCYGHAGIETPVIDRLAAEGTLYENVLTAAPITLPSHTTIFTGVNPIAHGVRENGGFYLPEEAVTLAEILRDQGYETAAFVGAFPLDSQTGIDQGFDLYDDNYPTGAEDRRHPLLKTFYPERPASEVSAAAVTWLEERGDRPFFLWTHYFDPHQPQSPPSPYRERYAASLYDGEIAFVDESVGRTVQALEEQGLLDKTLIVLTADHGESLGEHGEMTHAVLLYSASLRVPLIIRDPQRLESKRVGSLVGTVDILPTVLHRLGLPVPGSCQGKVLPGANSATAEPRELYAESLYGNLLYGWGPLDRLTRDNWTVIRGPRSTQLYDLAADPHELSDLSSERPGLVAELSRRASDTRDRLAPDGSQFSQGTVTAANRARLEALGYIGGAGGPADQGATALDPTRRDPHEMMQVLDMIQEARGLKNIGQSELAVPVLERATRLDPDNPWIVRDLALAFIDRGEFDRAKAASERLIRELDAEDVMTHLVLAEYEIAGRHFEEALVHLERASTLDPKSIATRMTMAYVLDDLGRLDEAEAVLREVLAVEPNETLALNSLATLVIRQQRVDEGVEILNLLRERQPYYAPAHLNLGVIYHDLGNPQESLRLARRALALRADYAAAVELEAMDLEELGMTEEAVRAWRRLAEVAKDEDARERSRVALERLTATSG